MRFSDEEIEQSRRDHDIPNDWDYAMCENHCGELVFVPSGVMDIGVRIICSAECSIQLLDKIK